MPRKSGPKQPNETYLQYYARLSGNPDYKPRYKPDDLPKYNVEQRAGESAEKYYRRLAKAADQRLVRIEQLSQNPLYANVKSFAYEKALEDIHKWNGVTASRFNTVPPESPEDLQAKIEAMKSFLGKQTSTQAGINLMYKRMANAVNAKYGTNFTYQQIMKYYSSNQNEKWSNMFGSKTALKVIGNIQKSAKKLKKDISDEDKRNIIIANINSKEGKTMLERRTLQALKSNELSLEDLY